MPDLPDPILPEISGTWNVVVTGIGGTGAVTIGSVLATAAHVEGRGAGLVEMAGLAQKGGAVQVHLRIAQKPEDISAIRVSPGQADAILGGDLVTTASAAILATMAAGRTRAVVNAHATPTGAFTRDPDFRIPDKGLKERLVDGLGDGLFLLDATRLAAEKLGDAVFANMLLTGAAWQKGLLPIGKSAIYTAITLNGAAEEANRRAFELGRLAAVDPGAVEAAGKAQVASAELDLDALVSVREAHLISYQSTRLARRYRRLVDLAPRDELRRAVALGYHKLLSYKDEYEVARLLSTSADKVAHAFEGDYRLSWHLAPPILSRSGPDGRPRKRAFGQWVQPAFRLLSSLRFLRGSPLDPFAWQEERRMERRLIHEYEADMATLLRDVPADKTDTIRQLAELPTEIRGFGPVKAAAVARYEVRRQALLESLGTDAPVEAVAAE
jgi:indolepyruvate ferredoxin oxidoreductase